MNVNEAIAKWKQVREMYDWPVFPPTAMDVVIAEVEQLRAELAAAKAASVCPVEMQNEQDGEQIAIKGMSHFYGDLWILHDGDEYFWLLDNYNGGDWQPIIKQLYDALLDYNKRAKEADKTPPEA